MVQYFRIFMDSKMQKDFYKFASIFELLLDGLCWQELDIYSAIFSLI